MPDIYEFIEECKANGLSAREAENEYFRALDEEREERERALYDDPVVQAGWAQQDVIDTYRRER